MRRLLYISTSRTPILPEQLDRILRVSRANNAAVGVTGLLVVGGRRFLQALEGPDDAVRATYERIRADPRHFAAVILADQAITERTFSAWSMGYQPGAPLTGEGKIADDVAALVAPIADSTLRGYFSGFAQTQAAA
ncbi:BLUF domain-containing protein [Sphingomonas sp.]|uniref:BLUF domain-containing protein n=1 Tax=Sphingomonas sp. TaxID=28214 RepID=UPI0035BC2F23